MGIFSWIFWGLFVGAIARLLLPGRATRSGSSGRSLLGVAGSILGGFLATEVLDIADSDEFDFGSFLIAVGGSVLLLRHRRPLHQARREKREREAALAR